MTLRGALSRVLLCALLASAACGCGETLDSLGKNSSSSGGSAGMASSAGNAGSVVTGGSAGSAGMFNTIRPVTGPSTYYNAFGDLTGKTEAEITKKLNDGFQQLFYGGKDQFIFYQN
ncbi:MAG TPA: hypothetical protein VGJ91_01625, partial [Polyangiaceae bacterium]